MSLIPSESTSFPDLLGWRHTRQNFPKAPSVQRTPVPDRVREAKPSSNLVKPSMPSPVNNGAPRIARTPEVVAKTVPALAAQPSVVANRVPPATAPPRAGQPPNGEKIVEVARPSTVAPAKRDEAKENAPVTRTVKPVQWTGPTPALPKISRTVLPPVRMAPAPARLRPLSPSPQLSTAGATVNPPAHARPSLPPGAAARVNFPPVSAPKPEVQPEEDSSQPYLWETEEFVSDETKPWPNLQQRRRVRLVRCLVIEAIVLTILALSAYIAFSHRMTDDLLSWSSRILTIVAGVVAALVPILFYGLPDTLPRQRL